MGNNDFILKLYILAVSLLPDLTALCAYQKPRGHIHHLEYTGFLHTTTNEIHKYMEIQI